MGYSRDFVIEFTQRVSPESVGRRLGLAILRQLSCCKCNKRTSSSYRSGGKHTFCYTCANTQDEEDTESKSA